MGTYVATEGNPNARSHNQRVSVNEPSMPILAAGYGDVWLNCHVIVSDGKPDAPRVESKPPFRVPSMREVRDTPWNGLTVASTFSGCGGSSLGYRMAGFRVAWANEFVPAAQDSYRANMAPGTVLDGRDVRKVRAAEVLRALGVREGELDLLDGSPPCQAFSLAGKRDKGWGKEREYEHGARQKNETLFDEYLRLLRGIRPRAFVAENVAGLGRGVAKGFFLDILGEMKACGYAVEARLLDAQWLGVPQTRSRIIFVGVREDLGLAPAFPRPLPYRYSIRDAIPWIADQPRIIQQQGSPGVGKKRIAASDPVPTVCATQAQQFVMAEGKAGKRKFTILEVKRLCSFPDDFELSGTYGQQWERLGNSVPPLMMRAVAEAVRDEVLLPAAARTGAPARRSPDRSTSGSRQTGAGKRRTRRRGAGGRRKA